MHPTKHPKPILELITLPAGVHGATMMARDRALEIGRNFRAPHHTAGVASLCSEIAVAAGGVLYLDEPEEIPATAARMLYHTVEMMHPDTRPVVILAVREHIHTDAGLPCNAGMARAERIGRLFDGWDVACHTVVEPGHRPKRTVG